MFDTHTAIIPEIMSPNRNSPLVPNLESVNQTFGKSLTLKTFNPNSERFFLFFGYSSTKVKDEDVPYINRSFYFLFDICSPYDEDNQIQQSFNLFTFELKNPTDDNLIFQLEIYIIVDLTLIDKSQDPISGIFIRKYEGTVHFSGEIQINGNKSTFKSSYYNVKQDENTSDSVLNDNSDIGFQKSKYKEMKFYSVLSPQFVFVNVFIIIFLVKLESH